MANSVQVLLQEDVDNLGKSGDLVRVRPGFARNYLVPRGLALTASKANIARLEELKRAALARAAQQLVEANALGAKLGALAVKLARAVGEDSRMYGSVTSRDICEAFAALGLEFDRRAIHLAEPIKSLGLHEVPAKLHREVTVTLRVEVVKA